MKISSLELQKFYAFFDSFHCFMVWHLCRDSVRPMYSALIDVNIYDSSLVTVDNLSPNQTGKLGNC